MSTCPQLVKFLHSNCWSYNKLLVETSYEFWLGAISTGMFLRAGGRLHGSFLHHTPVEASLIPAGKKGNLDNEVQSQLSPASKGAI